MPWRKRKASRMLLLPLALAPTIMVKGPSLQRFVSEVFEVDQADRCNHGASSQAGLPVARRAHVAVGGGVVAQGFQDGPFVGAGVGQFDERLQHSWWNRALRCSPRLSKYSLTRT